MYFKNIYKKPINRKIEGVIKADDTSSLYDEIDEYVLTDELTQRLGKFFDAYNNYSNANGVWISGFFGSGKSHLLKILSIILENDEIDGKKPLDIFAPKCADHAMLEADLKNAATIPSKSILFNIDQKADVISKHEIDALLSVFVKVFDEMCGYFGKQGYIAKFERDLDSRNQYRPFKAAFRKHAGMEWEEGREQAILEAKNIALAYADVAGGDANDYKDILSQHGSSYKVSIDDFADEVWRYIKTREKGFRLNFFVDEVGQYIADNTKLMTNLQTIAESLATKCKGQAWIIVTAQEDMTDITGEMSKKHSHDFSKIQARFANRVNLTSRDVAEVIQKRLLTKNEEATQNIGEIYDRYSNDFRTLFDFIDGSHTYRSFSDKAHFVNSYPFIPYQFDLFQSSIRQLSQHDAFTGRQSSVGERSMLDVFQRVAVKLSEQESEKLATFDLMFDGIESVLKSQFQVSILNAQKTLKKDDFRLKVLKALFLVKYIEEFKPTVNNICILMRDAIDQDTEELKNKVEEALNSLEQQTYIRRNNIYYEYLTDEEKDIEMEIKSMDIDPDAEQEELSKIIFDNILRDSKIVYEVNKQSYGYARKLDDNLYSRDDELSIHIISPNDDRLKDEKILRSHNMGREELMIIMDPDTRLLHEITNYKRTEKYVRQNTRSTQVPTKRKILHDKSDYNRLRHEEIIQMVSRQLSKAKLIAFGKDLEITSSDPRQRIILGFQELVTMAYPNLAMLRHSYDETALSRYIEPEDSLALANENLEESETEVFAFINARRQESLRPNLKMVVEHFGKKPYGWPLMAVLCNIAKLDTRGKIECRVDSNILEGEGLRSALLNNRQHEQVLLETRQDFTPRQIREISDFIRDFFDETVSVTEPKALGGRIVNLMEAKQDKLEEYLSHSGEFPFMKLLEPTIAVLSPHVGKHASYYLQNLGNFKDELLELADSVIHPIQEFMSGEKREIYTAARDFYKNHRHDFEMLNSKDAEDFPTVLQADDCYKGEKIRRLKELHKELREQIEKRVEADKRDKKKALDVLRSQLQAMPNYERLNGEARKTYERAFENIAEKLETTDSMVTLGGIFLQFQQATYPALLKALEQSQTGENEPGAPPPLRGDIISIGMVEVDYRKALLESELDIEEYIEKFRQSLRKELKNGNKVQI